MAEVDLAHYSAALGELYRLRRALAYDAAVLEAYLTYATLPVGLRTLVRMQVDRMRAAARGDAREAYADVAHGKMQGLLMEAGASPTLTRGAWEAQQ